MASKFTFTFISLSTYMCFAQGPPSSSTERLHGAGGIAAYIILSEIHPENIMQH
jgi:hypothetical protein